VAVRKFILVTGQSNATEEPPAQSWEDENPYLSLRSPQHVATKAPQFANGAYNDLITLPYTFNGGQQTGILGDGARSDTWQYVNVLGLASQALRYLTFYDPTASYFSAVEVTNTYPGTGMILAGSNSKTLTTSVRWRSDPSGVKITRQRTGQTHTISSSSTGKSITLTEPMQPPPEVGELFSYEIETVADDSSTTQLGFKNQFGGLSFTAGLEFFPGRPSLEAATGGIYASYASEIRNNNGEAQPGRLTCRGRLLKVGDAFQLDNNTTGVVGSTGLEEDTTYFVTRVADLDETLTATFSASNDNFTIGNNDLGDREPIRLSSPTPDNLSPLETYYVVKADSDISIAAGNWDESSDTLTITAHGFAENTAVAIDFRTGSNLPTTTPAIAVETVIYAKRASVDTVELYADQDLTTQITWTVDPTGASTLAQKSASYQILEDQVAVASSDSWVTADNQINITGHGLTDGEQVYFTDESTLPSGVLANTTYFVEAVTADAIKLYTSWAPGIFLPTALVTFTAQGGAATIKARTFFKWSTTKSIDSDATCTITRKDSHATVYVSDTPGGAELTFFGNSGRDPEAPSTTQGPNKYSANELKLQLIDVFRGSLTGLQARCIDGAPQNEGQVRALGDVTYTGTKAQVVCDAFPATPGDGDTFVIEPQNQVAEFHKWAMWLPWCPFEGKAQYDGPVTVTWQLNLGLQATVTGLKARLVEGTKVRFHSSGSLPAPVNAGQDYFIYSSTLVVDTEDTYLIKLKASYDATSEMVLDVEDYTELAVYGVHSMYVVDSLGKSNPFPPGFNYPNHYAVPRPYQPFDGTSYIAKPPSASFHTSLGYRFYEHYGEVFNIALAAIGQSSVGHKEVRDVDTILTGHSWYDRMQFKSWSPGEPNNCFSRVLDTLDAAKTAFEAEGDTGECVGIFYAQGETDAFLPRLADNYENGMRKLKAAMRQAVKERGLTSLDEDKIPFIHPQIKNYDIYPGTEVVNAAITALADEDPYSRTVSVDGVELLPEAGEVHYSGKGMSLLGDRCYEAWKDIQRSGSSEVDICNLALTNIGDKATVTSINPSDGSHQADLCARYYPLARDLLLERHRWDFTIRHVSPVALTASGRTDWAYAFKLPSNFTGVISVLPKDSTDDQITQGTATPQPFAIESNASLDRVLYTNVPNVILRYQAKITDSTKFSQMFVHAVSWQLASMLAGALIKGDDGAAAVQNATRMAEFYTEKAAAYDSRSTREKPVVDGNINPWDR
jgi:hypothetical protein